MLKTYFVTCSVTRMLRYLLSYIRCHSRRYIVFLAYLKTAVGTIKKRLCRVSMNVLVGIIQD